MRRKFGDFYMDLGLISKIILFIGGGLLLCIKSQNYSAE
jgi:hypothetical protein